MTTLCPSKKEAKPDEGGRAVGLVLQAAFPLVPGTAREVVKGILCSDLVRTPKSCPEPTSDPAPDEGDPPVASAPPAAQTPTATAQPAARPVEVRRAVQPSPRVAVPPAAPTPARTVQVLRVPVFVVSEELAAAVSVGLGLATAVALILLWWLPARRRRQRKVASIAAAVGDEEYRKLTATLVANLSHELFTPLTPVKGYASMLAHGDLPPNQVQKVAGEMAGASDRLQRVLDSLVAFAEVNAGADGRQDIVDTGVVVHQAVARAHPTEAHAIEVDVSRDVPSIRANERLLSAAVEALVDNAVKFSPNGGAIVVNVAIASGERERGREVRIRVTDAGVGMTAEELRTAREAFRQVDPSSTRRYGGLGLGLALADRVARVHGGQLQISSRPGRGSTFVLSIPLLLTERPEALQRLASG